MVSIQIIADFECHHLCASKPPPLGSQGVLPQDVEVPGWTGLREASPEECEVYDLGAKQRTCTAQVAPDGLPILKHLLHHTHDQLLRLCGALCRGSPLQESTGCLMAKDWVLDLAFLNSKRGCLCCGAGSK